MPTSPLTNALVTGASSGLGREIVRQLVLDRDMTVLATARRRDRLEQLADSLPPGKVVILDGDLANPQFRNELWQFAEDRLGHVDLLVNNAGLGNYAEFYHQDESVIRAILNLNVTALIDLTQRAILHMKPRGSGQILQISSVLGDVGIPYSAVYVASKHAVNGLVKSLRYELRGTGVRLWAACPGRTESEFSRQALGPDRASAKLHGAEPTEHVVRAILRGLDRDRAFLYPSWRARISRDLLTYLPAPLNRLLVQWATQHIRRAIADESRPTEHGLPR